MVEMAVVETQITQLGCPQSHLGRDASHRVGARRRAPLAGVRELDALVASGVYESRAAAVRSGVEAITALEHCRQIDRAIVAGYQRTPPTALDHDAALVSLRDAIAEEPW